MRKVQFTETVLRDANQSLMATRLPYADYADILPAMDKAGYYSIECWGGATFDSCLRYLNEDPWERLRNLRKNLPNNKLQMLLRGQNLLGYKHYHDDVVEKFIELSIKNGIDIIRIFDALNDFRNCETALNATMKYATKNTIASGCICYTQSPVLWVWRISGMSPTASLMPLMRCSASYGVMVPAISFRQMVWNPIRLSSLHISTYFSTVCTGLWV